jgi:hypothetical protein
LQFTPFLILCNSLFPSGFILYFFFSLLLGSDALIQSSNSVLLDSSTVNSPLGCLLVQLGTESSLQPTLAFISQFVFIFSQYSNSFHSAIILLSSNFKIIFLIFFFLLLFIYFFFFLFVVFICFYFAFLFFSIYFYLFLI